LRLFQNLTLIAALTLSACGSPKETLPPINPDSGATFRIYAVMYNPHGEPARRPRGGAVLGEDALKFIDTTGKTFIVELPTIVDETCLSAIGASGIDEFRPSLDIQFNDACADKFGRFTTENLSKNMAVVVNGELISAPFITTPILGGDVLISGFGNLAEIEAIARSFY